MSTVHLKFFEKGMLVGGEKFPMISEAQCLPILILFKVSGVEGVVMEHTVYKLCMLRFACTTHSLNIDRRYHCKYNLKTTHRCLTIENSLQITHNLYFDIFLNEKTVNTSQREVVYDAARMKLMLAARTICSTKVCTSGTFCVMSTVLP